MKRLIFICLFSLFWSYVAISEPKLMDSVTQIRKQLVKDYFKQIDNMIHAVRIVESGLNDFAVGAAQDVGPLQITPIRIADYNQRTGKNYSHSDCFKWEVSREVFMYYANLIGYIPTNFEEVCRRWNRSSAWQDEKGQAYWERVSKHLNTTI